MKRSRYCDETLREKFKLGIERLKSMIKGADDSLGKNKAFQLYDKIYNKLQEPKVRYTIVATLYAAFAALVVHIVRTMRNQEDTSRAQREQANAQALAREVARVRSERNNGHADSAICRRSKRHRDDDETLRQKMLDKVRIIEQKAVRFKSLPLKKKIGVILRKLKAALSNKKVQWAIVAMLWTAAAAINGTVQYNTNMEMAAVQLSDFPRRYAVEIERCAARCRKHPSIQGEIRQHTFGNLLEYLGDFKQIATGFTEKLDRRLGRDSQEAKSLLYNANVENMVRHDTSREYLSEATNGRDSEGYMWAARVNELISEYRRYYNREIAESRAEREETARIAREAAQRAEQRRREREAEFGH